MDIDQQSRQKTQVPLFPKSSSAANSNRIYTASQPGSRAGIQIQEALNDSNTLENLFTAPETKNTKSFATLIEEKRHASYASDPKMKIANDMLAQF